MLSHIPFAALLALCLGHQPLLGDGSPPTRSPMPAPLATATAGQLPRFLFDIKGASGWKRVDGEILIYGFIPDGRLIIQGPDGEATLWLGRWRLQGNQITLRNAELKTTKTVTVASDGADLLLGNVRYRRNTY